MTLLERSTCKITALNSIGFGVGVSDNSSTIVEVPYTIPQEVIEFEKHSYRNKSSFVLSKILKTSDHRVVPPCKYFAICGGCSLQHLKLDYYLQYKLDTLSQLLAKHDIETFINTIKSIGAASRRRAIFEAVKKHDQLFLGFKKFQSDKIVNIDSCLVLLPELSELIDKLKFILFEILENKEKCKIIVTKADNGIVLTLEMKNNRQDSEIINTGSLRSQWIAQDDGTLKNFCQENDIIKLTIIDDAKWHVLHLAQQPYIAFEDIKVAIESDSFLQVSSASDRILAEILNDVFKKLDPRISRGNDAIAKLQIVDLFCGRGTLTIPATKFGAVDGFESEKASVKALREALKRHAELTNRQQQAHNRHPEERSDVKTQSLLGLNNKKRLDPYVGLRPPLDDGCINIYQRDLFTTPLSWSELNKYDIAIINPPRAGAKEQAASLATSTVKTIIYLSCNPETFARDAKIILREGRYILEEITPIDQFYWSHHLEVMGVFKLA